MALNIDPHWLMLGSYGSVIILFAFFIRSLTGFGGALIAVPLLALKLDLRYIVPMETLLEVGLSIILLPTIWRYISWRLVAILAIGTVVGSVAGTWLLSSLANPWLAKVLGVAVLLYGLSLWLPRRNVTENDPHVGWGLLAGSAGGILGGLFGTSGPPYVIYLGSSLVNKNAIRGSLIGLFTLDYGLRAGLFTASGLMTSDVWIGALILTPAMAIGLFLGHKAQIRIDETQFQRILSGILCLSGLLLILG